MSAEVDHVFVDREVGHTATEFEKGLARIAVTLVLPDGVVRRLFGQQVLQFESEDGESVDEEPDIERSLGLVPAVAKLTGDSEAVQLEAPFGLQVLGRWGAVEEIKVVRAVLDAVAKDVDGASLVYFALQAFEKLMASGAVFAKPEGGGRIGLGCVKESLKLDEVDAVLPVVVVVVAGGPAYSTIGCRRFPDRAPGRRIARITCQCLADQPFKAAFCEVGGHHIEKLRGCILNHGIHHLTRIN